MVNKLLSDILPDEPANLANSTKLVVAAADYFQDLGLHCQHTVKMDPKSTNGLQRTDHRGASRTTADLTGTCLSSSKHSTSL